MVRVTTTVLRGHPLRYNDGEPPLERGGPRAVAGVDPHPNGRTVDTRGLRHLGVLGGPTGPRGRTVHSTL